MWCPVCEKDKNSWFSVENVVMYCIDCQINGVTWAAKQARERMLESKTPYINELLLEFKNKSGLKLTESQSDLFVEKLANYGLATVHDEDIFNEALKISEELEKKKNKESVFMFQDMISEIEALINDTKSEDLLKVRDIIGKYLG